MSRQLRVAYVLTQFPDPTETFILSELRALLGRGVDLTILSLRAPWSDVRHPGDEELVARTLYSPYLVSRAVIGAQVHYLLRRPLAYLRALAWVVRDGIGRPTYLVRALAIFPKAVRFARDAERRRVEFVHAHWATYPAAAARVIALLAGVPFGLTAHAVDLYAGCSPSQLRRRLEAAAFLATISEYNRRYLVACAREAGEAGAELAARVRLVRCGVEVENFAAASRDGKNASRPLVLAVARLVEKKGLVTLIEACRRLRERGIEVSCVIAGDGPERRRLLGAAAAAGLDGAVEITGFVSQERIRELYRRATVFALPCQVASSGDRDGIPVALMEAMAAGLPVVTTPISGIPELVHDEVSGILVPPGDPEALAGAIARVVADPELARRLGVAAVAKVAAEFDARRNAGRLLACIAGALGHPLAGLAAPTTAPGEGAVRSSEQRFSSAAEAESC